MRGFVTKLTSKSGTSPKTGRAYTKYSFIVEDEQGNESGWITYGFEKPPFSEGNFIEFEVTENNGFKDYKKGSGKIISNPPPKASARASTANSGPSTGSGNAKERPAAVGGVEAGPADRQTQIVLQHSQEMAIAAVNVLLTHDALPIIGTKSKAGEAKRFEEIVSAIDKLTVKFHNDVATGRLLGAVADMGIVETKPDAPIPAAGQQNAASTVGEY